MDTLDNTDTFFKESKRFCRNNRCLGKCNINDCQIGKNRHSLDLENCAAYFFERTDEAIAIIKQWYKEDFDINIQHKTEESYLNNNSVISNDKNFDI